MVKIGLLVGVSEYRSGFEPLASPVKDVEKMQEVLLNLEIGGFSDVKLLENPTRQQMEEAIFDLFADRQPDDLVLFYFSGHGIKDRDLNFYLATSDTRKNKNRILVTPTAVAASFLQTQMTKSRSQREIIILDCCFSGSFAKGLKVKGEVDSIEAQLGGKGRAIFTSSSSAEVSFEQEDKDLSIYTRYLVEGIETGAADINRDGFIDADELHQYVCSKVQEASPDMTPQFYPVQEGFKIYLARSPFNVLKLEYRKEVDRVVIQDKGKIDYLNRIYLDELRTKLGLSDDEAKAIETEAIELYPKRQKKLQRYREAFSKAIQQRYPLREDDRNKLKRIQKILELTDEDVGAIETKFTPDRNIADRSKENKDNSQIPKSQTLPIPIKNNTSSSEQKVKSSLKPPPVSSKYRTEKIEPQRQLSNGSASEVESIQEQDKSPLKLLTRGNFLKLALLTFSGTTLAIVGKNLFSPPLEKRVDPPPQKFKEGNLKDFEFPVVTVDAKGQEVKREQGKAQYFTLSLGNDEIALDMVSLPGGKFMMGTEDEEIERLVKKYNSDWFKREKPQHYVTVEPFFMSKFPVTQEQWRQVAKLPKIDRDLEQNSSNFKGDNRPVERVSWYDADEFCKRLSKETGKEYRLPSEAEWEYACRAGTTTPFHFGETITSELANYNGNYTYASEPKGEYRQQTTPVGKFPPNAFGLYDMHGNVWEWCADYWHENYQNAPNDGKPWLSDSSSMKVIRGGSWFVNPNGCRSASRNDPARVNRHFNFGFRVMRVASRTT